MLTAWLSHSCVPFPFTSSPSVSSFFSGQKPVWFEERKYYRFIRSNEIYNNEKREERKYIFFIFLFKVRLNTRFKWFCCQDTHFDYLHLKIKQIMLIFCLDVSITFSLKSLLRKFSIFFPIYSVLAINEKFLTILVNFWWTAFKYFKKTKIRSHNIFLDTV